MPSVLVDGPLSSDGNLEQLHDAVKNGSAEDIMSSAYRVQPELLHTVKLNCLLIDRAAEIAEVLKAKKRLSGELFQKLVLVKNVLIYLIEKITKSLSSVEKFQECLSHRLTKLGLEPLISLAKPLEISRHVRNFARSSPDIYSMMKIGVFYYAMIDPYETMGQVFGRAQIAECLPRMVDLLYDLKPLCAYTCNGEWADDLVTWFLDERIGRVWDEKRLSLSLTKLVVEMNKKKYRFNGTEPLLTLAKIIHVFSHSEHPDNLEPRFFPSQVALLKELLNNRHSICIGNIDDLDRRWVYEYYLYMVEYFGDNVLKKQDAIWAMNEMLNRDIIKKLTDDEVEFIAERFKIDDYEPVIFAYLEPCMNIPLSEALQVDQFLEAELLYLAAISSDPHWLVSKANKLNFDIQVALSKVLSFLTINEWMRLTRFLRFYYDAHQVLLWMIQAVKQQPDENENVLCQIANLQETIISTILINNPKEQENLTREQEKYLRWRVFDELCMLYSKKGTSILDQFELFLKVLIETEQKRPTDFHECYQAVNKRLYKYDGKVHDIIIIHYPTLIYRGPWSK